MTSIRLGSLALVAVLLVAPELARAQHEQESEPHRQQETPRREEPPVCLGFAFGAWTPPLDWKAAGHETRIDQALLQRAEDGRDWATTQAVQDEHTIVLLPSWWPVGVSVTLPNRAPAPGDTVVGTAFAFIADGRKKAPTAKVRAWRVPCTPRAP
jgi:hypothetical protein